MKIGDLVIFTDEGSYAKWFFGKIGIVTSYNDKGTNGPACSVNWIQPVKYMDRFTSKSNFSADKFTVYSI
tara:strand:- start:270 stop:479 length:210 start_codon:yes stop_codon:yes gene_type:complete